MSTKRTVTSTKRTVMSTKCTVTDTKTAQLKGVFPVEKPLFTSFFRNLSALFMTRKKTAKNTIYINIYKHTDLPGGIGML